MLQNAVIISIMLCNDSQRQNGRPMLFIAINYLHPQNISIMNYRTCALILVFGLCLAVSAQLDNQAPSIYKPFTAQQLSEATHQPIDPASIPAPHPQEHKKHHKKPKHHREEEEDMQMQAEDEEEEYFDDLTEEEREDRRRETKRFHKFFKFGLVIGTGVLAVIVFKFCVAKRRRCREMRQARRPAEVQMQPNAQPYLYNIQAPTYPQPVPFQVARPYQPQPQPPVVRGRPHDSFIRQAQPVVNSTEAQIRFHENEILRLRELRREECFEQRRNPVPITTTESFESSHPIHRQRQIPVGQPIRDDNSSFASEYPEI